MHRAVLLLALWLGACSGGGADDPGSPGALNPEGEKFFRAYGCLQCHGARGDGGSLAPPLERLSDNWTREEIAVYLSDPLTYVERTPRLKALKQRYGMQMPALSRPEDERLTLADYVLALSAARVAP